MVALANKQIQEQTPKLLIISMRNNSFIEINISDLIFKMRQPDCM